jgi:type III secretory pathway component EscS
MDPVLREIIFVVIVGMLAPLSFICATSVVSAIIQSVTQVQEQSICFLVKLSTLILVLYFGSTLVEQKMIQLVRSSMQALINVR